MVASSASYSTFVPSAVEKTLCIQVLPVAARQMPFDRQKMAASPATA